MIVITFTRKFKYMSDICNMDKNYTVRKWIMYVIINSSTFLLIVLSMLITFRMTQLRLRTMLVD